MCFLINFFFFFFNDTATTEIYTLSLHDALPISGVKGWREFMKKYVPEGDLHDTNYVNAYNTAMVLEAVLKACGDDLSTENILRQAYSIKDLELPMLLPGIKVNTSANDHVPVDQMQFMRFNGKTWERFGELLTGN